MDLHPDFRDLLAECARSGVRYALIGGYAVGFHATPRATKDLDLLVSREGDNLARLAEALERFGAPSNVVEGARHLGPTEIVYLGVPPLRVDLLASADGVDPEGVIVRALHVDLDGVDVPIMAFEDLLANKRASGRSQDVADAEALERARSSRGGGQSR